MKKKITLIFLTTILLLIFILTSCCFKTLEGNKAVILRLGEIIKDKNENIKIYSPGFHFKLPILDNLKTFDMRLRNLTIDSSRIVTSEQKDVMIDVFLEWKIYDIPQYFRSLSGNHVKAELILKQFLENSLRAEIGKLKVNSLINSNRDQLMLKLTSITQEQAKTIGVEVKDVRIKQIDLPETVTDSIYRRMRSERQKVASLIRAQGEQFAESIKASADAEATVIIANAEYQSKSLKANADAEASEIYTNAYIKSEEFFNFWRNMQSYKTSFENENDTVFVIYPQGEFFKYFYSCK